MLRKIYRQERIPYEPEEEADMTDQFEEEWRSHIRSRSMEILKAQVSAHHYQIFYLLDVQHRKVKELAELYKVPPISIYTIRTRVETRLRKIVQELNK
jgi:DNA-directed RNA polymerase specialized sigma24 family protein